MLTGGDILENWQNTAALLAVAVGTAGVSGLGWLLSKRTSRAIAESVATAQGASERAAQAQQHAAQANERAEHTVQLNLGLQTNLERERIARLSLEKQLQYRTLTQQQCAQIHAFLSSVPKFAFCLRIIAGDQEALSLSESIRSCLTSSGLTEQDSSVVIWPAAHFGLTIVFPGAGGPEAERNAVNLFRALCSSGHTVNSSLLRDDDSAALSPVTVIIGARPGIRPATP